MPVLLVPHGSFKTIGQKLKKGIAMGQFSTWNQQMVRL